MKKAVVILTVTGIVLILIFAAGPFYILTEGEVAVITRLGAIVGTETTAGLKFKAPVIDKVYKYTKKLITWDGEPQRIPTAEQQYIFVDATARYRIVDPEVFYKTVISIDLIDGKISPIIDASIKSIITENLLEEAVRNSNYMNNVPVSILPEISIPTELLPDGAILLEEIVAGPDPVHNNIVKGRTVLSEEMYTRAAQAVAQFGIVLEDIIIRQIRYSDDLTQSVYNRMVAERHKEAATRRSTGEGGKAEWLGKLENEKRTILSQAYSTAEEIRGRADAEATTIYAEAANRDPEFYRFWRSIESYRKTIPDLPSVLSTDMDYFRYLYSMNP
ncbi:MAG: protease modulator HflC [Spirochaetales bacterium]|jgi:membrane protease subunit HflC|nr:protease modulator HflC [Spirochaetales bacterium]